MEYNTYRNHSVISNEQIAKDIFKMTIVYQKQMNPGQFFMLRAWDSTVPYLSRPISVCDYDKNIMTFLYLVKGDGTDIISKLQEGKQLSVLGALGNGFDLSVLKGKVALVSGGIGIAPFKYLARELKKSGSNVTLFAGFKDEPYFIDEMKPYLDEINLYSETDSNYKKGYPTDEIDEDEFDFIVTCGPTLMMNVLKQKIKDKKKLYLSLENKMGCGIGACLSCSVKTKDGMKTVCTHGPVFRADEV